MCTQGRACRLIAGDAWRVSRLRDVSMLPVTSEDGRSIFENVVRIIARTRGYKRSNDSRECEVWPPDGAGATVNWRSRA
jgi:hypothetical protein